MKKLGIVSALALIIAGILYAAIPVKRYMKIKSMHWYWYIDIFEYRSVHEERFGTEEFDSKYYLFSEREPSNYDWTMTVPENAYNVRWTLEESEYHDDKQWYRFKYTYNVNRFVKVKELCTLGKDKFPYEHECDLPEYIDNPKFGDLIRQSGHTEEYKVTGFVDDKLITVNIPADTYFNITENDEFEYRKYRFGKEIFDIKIAE